MVKERIKNEKDRLATFKRRKASVLKKAWELTTLCGIEAGVIIYGPKHEDQPVQPETWVPEGCDLTDIIKKFKELKSAQKCKQFSAINLNRRNAEANGDAKQTVKINNYKYTTWDERLDFMSDDQLKVVLERMESKLGDAATRLNMVRGEDRTAVNYQEHSYAPIDSGLNLMMNNGNFGYYSGGASSSGGNLQQGESSSSSSSSLQKPTHYHQQPIMMMSNNLWRGNYYVHNIQPVMSHPPPTAPPPLMISDVPSDLNTNSRAQAMKFHKYLYFGSGGNNHN